MSRLTVLRTGVLVLMACDPVVPALGQDADARLGNVRVEIQAQKLATALEMFAEQANLSDYVFSLPRRWETADAPAVHGHFSVCAGLNALLAGTDLVCEITGDLHVSFRPRPADPPEVRKNRVAPEDDTGVQNTQEVRVIGRPPLNVDSRRTQDDAQPYTVVSRDQIDHSPGRTDDLLRRVLTANTQDDGGLDGGIHAGRSALNLRGLGENETLVLINGRRTSNPAIGGMPTQANLIPIPTAAIERIEILPATASAIYGGGATGGVVDVILRRDCETRLALEYGNTISADSGSTSAYFSQCSPFGDQDRTQLRFAAGLSHEAELQMAQRNFLARGREQIEANNPGFFLNGPPPLGAQTNIRLADGTITSIPAGYRTSAGVAPLLLNAGHYNLQPANSAQADGGARFVLHNASDTKYLNVTLDHRFADRLSMFVDATGTESAVRRTENLGLYTGLQDLLIPAAAPTNPFAQDVEVTVPIVQGDRELENRFVSKGVTAGLQAAFFEEGLATIEVSSFDSKLERAQPLANSAVPDAVAGLLDVFQDLNVVPLKLDAYGGEKTVPSLKSRSDVLTVRGDTPFDTASLRGSLRALLEYRNERFFGGPEFLSMGGAPATFVAIYEPQQRQIASAYAEARLRFGPHESPFLEVQLAGRYDLYEVRSRTPRVDLRSQSAIASVTSSFDSLNPTLGLQFWPLESLSFRASFGTGFVAPTADQFTPGPPTVFAPASFRDPRRGNELTGAIRFNGGGSPTLRPELSRSLSAGVVWKPESIAELRLSLDYFRTWKLDDIVSPADLFFQDPALFESVYPYRVKRGPRATDDPNAVGPIEEIDGTSLNVARSLVEAFDLALDYTLKGTRIGNVNFWLRGTYEPTLWLRTTAGSPRQNLAGLSGNALKFSGVTGLTVERGRWRTDWTTRYLGRYSPGPSPVILANQGAQYVSAQTCHDVSLSYRPSAAESLTLTLSALNVLNRAPAYDASSASYASPLVDPRMRRFMFSVTKVF